MITKNGVVYDLRKSPFKYKCDGLNYVFSSQNHLDKFRRKYKENRDIINYSLSKRFNLNVDVSQLADVVLYRKIETRGFLIESEKGIELCQKDIKCVGLKVTHVNLIES